MRALRMVPVVLLFVSMGLQAQTLTAGEAIAKIQRLYGTKPGPGTVDTIKVGDPKYGGDGDYDDVSGHDGCAAGVGEAGE